MTRLLMCTLFFLPTLTLSAQIWNGQDTLYGNEWIQSGQAYYKIQVAEDGIYRIPFQTLANAGISADAVQGRQFQLFHLGQEIPIYTTTEGAFSTQDYLEFYGIKNRSELDRFLYRNPESARLLNPEYSLFTDTSTYYLTWAEIGTATKRYETITNNLNNPPPKETAFSYTQKNVYSDYYIKEGGTDGGSHFEEVEGFSGLLQNVRTLTFSLTQAAANIDSAEVYLRLATDNGSHQLKITANSRTVIEENFFGYQLREYRFSIPVSRNNPTVDLRIEGLNGGTDRHVLSNVFITYPHQYRFGNQSSTAFLLKASDTPTYLEIEDFNRSGAAPILYDWANQQRLVTTISGNRIRAVLPPSARDRNLVLVHPQNGVTEINHLKPIQFIDFTAHSAEFLILSHHALSSGTTNQVQEYAAYRQSQQGGGFETLIVEVEQLYEQFGYGIHRHPLSIRNFAHFIKKHWPESPQYVFIIGKGREYRFLRSPAEFQQEVAQNYFFIPTFGWPGADNLLFSNNYSATPLFPIGRIAATSPNEVRIYLEKIKQFERLNEELPQTIEARGWMKRIIHLGGGNTNFEQTTIKNHLVNMADIIEKNTFAGKVFDFYKSSSDPVQVSQSGQIDKLFNDGISLLTFFGHSNSNTFDFNIESPANLQNRGRYPIILSLGCFAGRMHGDFRSLGEQYVFAENKGTIGFLASTSQGYISDLRNFGENYYRRFGGELYGASVGEIVRSIIQQYDNGLNSTMNFLMQQISFQGDPALRLNPQPGPDYLIDASSVKITPAQVNVQLDSFVLEFDVANLGRRLNTPVTVEVTQELPTGEQVVVGEQEVTVSSFTKKVSFTIPTLGAKTVGQNRFFITVDPQNVVEELPAPAAESNNNLQSSTGELGFRFFIFSNDVAPLYPLNYGIVGNRTVTLKASTLNTAAPKQRYFIELDTSRQFNSVTKIRTELEQSGGVLKWQTNLTFPDSTVYYWRISPDSTSEVGYTWKTSSFMLLENAPEGWNQSHYYQFTDDDYDNLRLTEQRNFQYVENVSEVKVNTGFFPTQIPELVFNNGIIQSYTPATVSAGVYIAVFDPVQGTYWTNAMTSEESGGQYGSYNSTGNTINVFPFQTDTPEERRKVIDFLTNVVPDNHYVAFFTIQRSNRSYEPQRWAADSTALGTNLFQLLENQGATQVRSLATSEQILPYIFIYKKNTPDFEPIELVGNFNEGIESKFEVKSLWHSGTITSTIIGPAQAWSELHWKTRAYNPSEDVQWLNVYGIRKDGTTALVKEKLDVFTALLDDINAEEFPRLQLEYFSEDRTFRTTPQLEYWRILYEGLPEAALQPNVVFELQKDTVQQGELLRLKLAVENVSSYGLDSLLVRYRIVDENNREDVINQRLKPLAAGDTLIAQVQYDTRHRSGEQSISIEINPDDDQPELYHFNNIGVFPFFVEQDKRNPNLDVTFDGVHIMDGDIISPKPVITIALKDENPYLALSDTALFNIQLRYPGELEYHRIPFNSGWITFYPASPNEAGSSNRATVEFTPTFSEEGTYELAIQATDATGNLSGAVGYRVSFDVILKTSISRVLNYPNPFTTSTRFVYTLTGEVPDYFSIQIMTVSGRIVRELTQAELGPLRVGTHQTDFSWDGTDEFGDKLANGVYLYRIIAKKETGETFEHYETGADRFFTNEIGKLVILR